MRAAPEKENPGAEPGLPNSIGDANGKLDCAAEPAVSQPGREAGNKVLIRQSHDQPGLIRWTRFASVTDTRGTEQVSTWEAFVEMLRNSPPRAATKDGLPLLKLATFSGPRSSATVAEVFGLEGDHDAGTMSAGEAIQRLERHGIRAVVHSTPNSTPERPRWRVLAPLSRSHPPAERARLAARLNGALDGALAPESFTPPQVFYYGAIEGRGYDCAATFDAPDEGACVDELHELDQVAAWPPGQAGNKPPAPAVATAEPGNIYLPPGTVADLRDALSRIPSDDRDLWVRFCLALKPCGQQGWDLWDEWSRKSAKYDPVDAARVWHTAKPRGEVNYESIFAVAEAEYGWVNPLAGGAVQMVEIDRPPPRIVEVDPRDADKPLPPLPFVVEGAIPCGQVTLLGAHGGTGKSFVALTLACHVALGRDFGHLRVLRPRSAVFVSLEDGREVLLYRLRAICDAYGFDAADLARRLSLLDATEAGALAEAARVEGVERLFDTAALVELRERIPAGGLVVVDNASDGYDANESERRHVRAFIRMLRRDLARDGGAVLLLAHTPKDAARLGRESYSGSTAWHNSARARLALARDGETLTLTVEKLNLGRPPLALTMRVNDEGVPLPDVRLPGIAPVPCDRNVLDAIRQACARGQPVPAARAGARPAGKVIHGLLEGLHRRAEIDAALERLLVSGAVVTREEVTKARHRREILVPAEADAPNALNAPNAALGASRASARTGAPNAPNAHGGYGGIYSAQTFGEPMPDDDTEAATLAPQQGGDADCVGVE